MSNITVLVFADRDEAYRGACAQGSIDVRFYPDDSDHFDVMRLCCSCPKPGLL